MKKIHYGATGGNTGTPMEIYAAVEQYLSDNPPTSQGDVTLDGEQELTNKTIDGDENTLQNIPAAAIKGSDTEPLQFKTVAGQSILGNGDIPASTEGGGSAVIPLFYEDFVGGTQGINLIITQSGSGATGGAAVNPTIDGAIGMLQIHTGTTTTGRGHLGSFQGAIYSGSWLTTGICTFETNNFRIVNKSTGPEAFRLMIGFGDTNSAADQANGCYFTTKTTDDLLYMVTANSGVRTETATDISITDNLKITSLKIVIDNAAQSAKFYYNGTLKGTLTANIPQSAFGIGYGIFKSTGTIQRRIDVDNIKLTVA